jgi:hypothetical protein
MSDDENVEHENIEDTSAISDGDNDENPTDEASAEAATADSGDSKADSSADAAATEEDSLPEPALRTPPPPPPSVPEVDLTTLGIGDRVKCWCGKIDCKDFTLHKVTELPEGKKPRAVCLQCGAVHFVRLKMPGSSRRATPAVNPWIKAVAGVTLEQATQYTLQGDFSLDQYLLHTRFGLGQVIDRVSDTKISVLFEHGTKLLVHQYAR